VIHVIAVSTAIGGNVITANAEQTQTIETAASDQPKAKKKARVGAQSAHVAPTKAKSGKKATPAKKAPKAPKGEKKGGAARDGSKAAKILEEAAGRGHLEGTDEGHRLAAAFGTRVPVGHDR